MAEVKKEPEKLNVYQKLQRCRVELQKSSIKASGENTYSKYTYYELGDFLPKVNELMDKYNLIGLFNYEDDSARLEIIDTEKPEDLIIFTTPVKTAELKGCHAIQNIGATQTYARRYLYIMAFEIALSDSLDLVEHDEELIQKQQKISAAKVGTINAMLEKTGADVPVFLKYYKLKKVEDITNEQFPIVMNALQKKLDDQGKAAAPELGKIPDLGM